MLNEKLRGGGGNEYLGILTALAASSLGPTISVAKETSQAAATILGENVLKMSARAWRFGNSIWLANHTTKVQLYKLNIPVGVGGTLLFQPSREVGFPDMLLGRPVFYTEYASAVGTQGDLILADFSQYLEGTYQPLQSAESIHVRFVNHERTFKFWLRNAGAPWWKTALTPFKGSDTLSPFVVLDTRA
jgi:HK97 family phage major capsid protein